MHIYVTRWAHTEVTRKKKPKIFLFLSFTGARVEFIFRDDGLHNKETKYKSIKKLGKWYMYAGNIIYLARKRIDFWEIFRVMIEKFAYVLCIFTSKIKIQNFL